MKPHKTKQDNFLSAVHRLEDAVIDYQNIPNDTVRDGMIQRFEFTFELGWKALKEYMVDAGMQNTYEPWKTATMSGQKYYRGEFSSSTTPMWR